MFIKLEIMGRERGAERQTEHGTASERETQHWGETDRQSGAERPTHTQWVGESEVNSDFLNGYSVSFGGDENVFWK